MSAAALDTLDRAELVRAVLDIRDRCDRMLDVLIPDGGAQDCPHLDVEDLSTMDDDGEQYRCRRCGQTSRTPFHPSSE